MPLTPDDRIVLVRVKVERAKKNLVDLEIELDDFRNKNLNVIRPDVNVGGSKYLATMVTLPVIPWNSLSAAGDVIHNLRSALDHLANQLVLVGTGAEEVTSRAIEFPIAKDVATYESEKTRKVKGMRTEAIEAIDRLKPYKGGNDALWRIHELDNIDKHRTLFTVAQDLLLSAEWLPNGWPYNLIASHPHFTGVFDPDVEKDLQFEITKAATEAQVVESNALLPSLRQSVDLVEGIVYRFRPFLK